MFSFIKIFIFLFFLIDCYETKDPNEHFVTNNDTIYYYFLLNNYKLCVGEKEDLNLTNTTCISCEKAFDKVNYYYDSITSNYSSHVCYDIVDSVMN
jgi:hypothetical protein